MVVIQKKLKKFWTVLARIIQCGPHPPHPFVMPQLLHLPLICLLWKVGEALEQVESAGLPKGTATKELSTTGADCFTTVNAHEGLGVPPAGGTHRTGD